MTATRLDDEKLLGKLGLVRTPDGYLKEENTGKTYPTKAIDVVRGLIAHSSAMQGDHTEVKPTKQKKGYIAPFF